MAPVAGDFRVSLRWVDEDGRVAFNVFHLKDTTAARTAEDVGDLVKVGPGVNACGPVSGHAAVTEIVVVNQFDTSDAHVVTVGDITEWTGGGGTGDYAPGLCAILRQHTAFAGRSGKGRMFLPFLTESAMTKGRLIGDALTLTAPAWATWFQDLTPGDDLVHTVWSEKLGTGHRVVSESMNPIPGFRRKRANEA